VPTYDNKVTKNGYSSCASARYLPDL